MICYDNKYVESEINKLTDMQYIFYLNNNIRQNEFVFLSKLDINYEGDLKIDQLEHLLQLNR